MTTPRCPSRSLRLVWLLLGLFFAGLTLRVLLWEVGSFSSLTADHLLTVGALVGAIASGVFVWQMLWAGKLLTAAGLGLAFAAATVYCLIGSAGRGDEATFEKNAAARQVNDDRGRAQRNRDEARRRYDAALEAETTECSGGAGTKCKAKREITTQRRSDFEVAELLLGKQKVEQRENGKLKRAAELIAFFGKVPQVEAERGLALIWPFIPPLVCELLTISFLHLAFGSVAKPTRNPPANDNPPLEPDGTHVEPAPIEAVRAWVTGFRQTHGRNPKINEVCAVFPSLSKTTAHRRCVEGSRPRVEPAHASAVADGRPKLKAVG